MGLTNSRGMLLSVCLLINLLLMSILVVAKPLDLSKATLADPGVINKEQILYWLIKRGEISESASAEDKRAAVEAYTHSVNSAQNKGELLRANFEQQRLKSINNHVVKNKSELFAQGVASTSVADSLVTKTVKVLAVLIDFPDLPYDNNRLSASDTPMYYPSYPSSHYESLIFSPAGFIGPQGQNLLTAYQYYQAVSGDSFFLTGEVKGWFTAANNASFYGGSDNANNKRDTAVPELVKEAVTMAVAGMSPSELAGYDVEDPLDLDGDGNVDEPDGNIDHVMLFHSSIGEESGGGVLGANAIWSHRFFVYNGSSLGYTIPGTGLKVFSYTVQPIDSAAGVVVHELGHVLGLPDEYDTSNVGKGSPVGSWSVMSGGGWAGTIAGTQPTGFSPYARSYLQGRYKGRWVNEQEILLDSIGDSGVEAVLNEAVNYSLVNQISIPLPVATIPFKQPYGDSYQYYSDQGNLIDNALSFDIDLPSQTPLTLTMKAHWNIEVNYDYVQVMIDGVVVAGNYTKNSNSINNARNILTGSSSDIIGAEGVNNWVDLEYDISAFSGRSNAEVKLVYITDQSVSEYGIAIDDVQVKQSATLVYADDAETAGKMLLAGFTRIDNERPGAERRYIVQLRSYNGVDLGLPSHSYEPGVLLWLENFSYGGNSSNSHPGAGLIGVIDADQNVIGTRNSNIQVRDATFSQFDQSSYFGDNHLLSTSTFDDNIDYSAPSQPASGIILPKLGLTMNITSQNADSSMATVQFNYSGITITPSSLIVSFSSSQGADNTVAFSATVSGGDGNYSYLWDFGDGQMSNESSPSHTYTSVDTYSVTLTVTDGEGIKSSNINSLTLVSPQVSSGSSGGSLGLLGLCLLALVRLSRLSLASRRTLREFP
ncbi:immune inhibitor A [Shewanella sp. VB17]|uniref:immune inhibitor A domain-containing protein n=1 Tax=Shewanella sp. VB17 TaxID=2739432 RepID=UPI001567928F|nr:immune inhibitor A domain-containing protein [Shewanella sp. VB17]NRD71724.1 immune inhibitor A [Shewanella sp. VB17]